MKLRIPCQIRVGEEFAPEVPWTTVTLGLEDFIKKIGHAESPKKSKFKAWDLSWTFFMSCQGKSQKKTPRVRPENDHSPAHADTLCSFILKDIIATPRRQRRFPSSASKRSVWRAFWSQGPPKSASSSFQLIKGLFGRCVFPADCCKKEASGRLLFFRFVCVFVFT